MVADRLVGCIFCVLSLYCRDQTEPMSCSCDQGLSFRKLLIHAYIHIYRIDRLTAVRFYISLSTRALVGILIVMDRGSLTDRQSL
jgi:hypothetical protein